MLVDFFKIEQTLSRMPVSSIFLSRHEFNREYSGQNTKSVDFFSVEFKLVDSRQIEILLVECFMIENYMNRNLDSRFFSVDFISTESF